MNDLNIIRFTLRLNENNNSSLLGKDSGEISTTDPVCVEIWRNLHVTVLEEIKVYPDLSLKQSTSAKPSHHSTHISALYSLSVHWPRELTSSYPPPPFLTFLLK